MSDDTKAIIPQAPLLPTQRRNLAIVPQSFEDIWRFATAVTKSGLAPKGIDSPEAAFVVIQYGLELGLGPMAALQGIANINGKPSIYGDLMLALARGSGLFDEAAFIETVAETEKEGLVATVTVRRLPDGKPKTASYSMAQAKKCMVYSKGKTVALADKPGPWQSHPERMLLYKARNPLLRDTFTELYCGMASAEEMRDVDEPEIDGRGWSQLRADDSDA